MTWTWERRQFETFVGPALEKENVFVFAFRLHNIF